MVFCGIASLLVSCAYAAAPIVAAVKPGTVGVMPKKIIAAEQDDKDQSKQETAVEEESRSSLMDKEIQVANNVFAAPHRDATVQLKISGFSQLDLGMTSQRQTDNDKKGASNAPYLHIGNTNLKMEASVKKDKMVTGWLVRFNPQVNGGCGSVVDRNGIFWKHDDVGQFDAGNIKGVDDALFKFAQGLIGGSNGWDGSLDNIFYHPDKAFHCDGTDFVGSTHTATKVSYITPKIGDVFTIAASYAPSTAHRGNMKMSAFNHAGEKGAKSKNNPNGFSSLKAGDGKYEPFGTNNITLVARLDKKCGDWTYGGAFAYIHDTAEVWAQNDKKEELKYALRDTNSFGFSGLIGYGKFKFGIEYMNNGKSRLPVDGTLSSTVNHAAVDEVKSVLSGVEEAPENFKALSKTNQPSAIYKIANGDKGHAGHVITTTAQYKWSEKLTCAFGYQWTYRKLNDDENTTRNTFTKTVNYRFMPGLEGYVEGDLIFLKNKNKDGEVKDNSNVGFVVVAGVRVNI
jgi:predicted porin